MPKLASYDNTVPSPSPVTGWYDTDVFDYPNLPTSIISVTDDQWNVRMANTYAVSDGVLVQHTPIIVYTINQQAIIALTEGVTITSANSTLDGVYAINSDAQSHIQSEVLSILLDGVFADGTTTVNWPDLSGNIHVFDVTNFKIFASAIRTYVAALYKVINGTSTTLPSPNISI